MRRNPHGTCRMRESSGLLGCGAMLPDVRGLLGIDIGCGEGSRFLALSHTPHPAWGGKPPGLSVGSWLVVARRRGKGTAACACVGLRTPCLCLFSRRAPVAWRGLSFGSRRVRAGGGAYDWPSDPLRGFHHRQYALANRFGRASWSPTGMPAGRSAQPWWRSRSAERKTEKRHEHAIRCGVRHPGDGVGRLG